MYNVIGMWATENKHGFSLVELIVVMAIMGVMATSVAVINVSKNAERTRDVQRKSDLELMRSALEQYRYDNGAYVVSTSGGYASSVLTALPTGYLANIPADPKPTLYNYYYKSGTGGSSYTLCGRLEGITPTPNACGSSVACGTSGVCNYQITNP
jgi:general secretion pathway protein G